MQVCPLVDPEIRRPRLADRPEPPPTRQRVRRLREQVAELAVNGHLDVCQLQSGEVRFDHRLGQTVGHQEAGKARHQVVAIPSHEFKVEPVDDRRMRRRVEDAVLPECARDLGFESIERWGGSLVIHDDIVPAPAPGRMEAVTSPEPVELDDDLYAEIRRLCALGDDLAEAGLYRVGSSAP